MIYHMYDVWSCIIWSLQCNALYQNQRSDLLESLASEAAKENLSVTVRTLDVTKKVTKLIKCQRVVLKKCLQMMTRSSPVFIKSSFLPAKIWNVIRRTFSIWPKTWQRWTSSSTVQGTNQPTHHLSQCHHCNRCQHHHHLAVMKDDLPLRQFWLLKGRSILWFYDWLRISG